MQQKNQQWKVGLSSGAEKAYEDPTPMLRDG